MGYWNSRGLRGSSLEEGINFTNERYRQKGLALLQKIATPITPIEVNNQEHTITKAYFGQQSTVDYIGVAQGVPICFDAKECQGKSLPLSNIKEHQVEFLADFEKQGGLGFLLVHFASLGQYYLLPFSVLLVYFEGAKQGGRKSIPLDAFEERYRISVVGGLIHYLEATAIYLQDKETSAVS